MHNDEESQYEKNFRLQVRKIRPRNLRELLRIYFDTYVKSDSKLMKMAARTTRFAPGLRPIQKKLRCSKGKAQDMLQAVRVIRTYFGHAGGEETTWEEARLVIRKVGLSTVLQVALEDEGIASVPNGIEKELAFFVEILNYLHSPMVDEDGKIQKLEIRLPLLKEFLTERIREGFYSLRT